MSDSTQPLNPSPGLIYRKSDYPGVFARISIDLIDFSALVLSAGASFWVLMHFLSVQVFTGYLLIVWILLGFAYLGPWKATRFPTLGYRIFGTRLVNAQGGRADFWQASGRAMFLLIGPINYLVDMFWLYGESPRQTLRDKFTGTYLIKRGAIVEARGTLAKSVLHVMGYRVVVEEIRRAAESE